MTTRPLGHIFHRMAKAHAELPARRLTRRDQLDREYLAEARARGMELAGVTEGEMIARIRKEREDRWRAENAEAIASINAYIEKHGLPLAGRRLF